MGGLGGFFPPLILSMLYNATGHYSIGFMALSEIALASLILVFWMFYQEKLKLSATILEHTTEAMIVTDINGTITSINPSFTAITGYTIEDVKGKNPNILQSGQQGKEFYEKMWAELKQEGSWQGEIWNKRKNGESYLEWLTISAIKNEGGEVKYYAGMFSDITTYRNKLKPPIKQMYV
jgi:MFS transporter, NNP family, nitrate/nitrite transporter